MALNERQRLFVDQYLVDLNATQAATRAGYSKRTAASQGERLLRNVEIQALIQQRMKDREKRTEITQDRILQELARIAFFDPRKLFDDRGNPIPISQLDDDTAAAVAGLDVLEELDGAGENRKFIGYVKKYKISDKNTALTNAMRHLGMLNDKLELSGTVNLAQRLAAARKRKNDDGS